MNDATDRRVGQELSRLGDGLAAEVSVPPVTRVMRRATPLRRALVLLEDVAAEVSVPPVTRVIRRAMPRRRAFVAACSICALGAFGATLVLVPGTPNGSTGPSKPWAEHAEGLDSTSQPLALIVPRFEAPWDAPSGVVPRASAESAAAAPVPAKAALAKPAAARQAPAKPAPAEPAAAGQAPAQPRLPSPLPTATTTTLGVTPTSPVPANTLGTLTATVSPSAAGSVQFKDHGTNVGSPVAVLGGTASMTKTLPSGRHSLTAVFTPANGTAYRSSTSNTMSYVVNDVPRPTPTTTTLGVTPTSPVPVNTLGTLTATVSPSAAGSVQFKDHGTNVGSPVAVLDGTASMTKTLPSGRHSLTAVFTPADTMVFSDSASNTVSYVVNAAEQITSTKRNVTPGYPAAANTTETLQTTVAPPPPPTTSTTPPPPQRVEQPSVAQLPIE